MEQTTMSSGSGRGLYVDWAANLIARIDSARSGAADHPSDILGHPVRPEAAIDVATRAFEALVERASRVAPSLKVYFVVELGSEDEDRARAVRDRDELSLGWLRSVVNDDQELAVGASGADATYGDAEVRTKMTRQSILTTTFGALFADLHELRYAGDPLWSVQARIWWQR